LIFKVLLSLKNATLSIAERLKEDFLKQIKTEQLFDGRDYHIFELPYYRLTSVFSVLRDGVQQ
jgi:hypothetical protein